MHRFTALLLCLIVGTALGDDGPPAPREEISETRFVALLERIQESDPTTIEFRDRVRHLARTTLVRRSGKVFDITPLKNSQGPVVDVNCIGVYGGPPRETFTVTGEEAAIVASWRRWDRISWLCDIVIDDEERVTLRRRFFSVDDLTRTPNPGLRYPRPATPVQKVGEFPDWLLKYASHASRSDWRPAWRMYDRARRKLWEIEATVSGVNSQSGVIRCDIERHVAVRARDSGVTWGIIAKTHSVEVIDPQVLDAIDVGGSVRLYLDIDGTDSLETFRGSLGALPINLSFARRVE